MKSINNNASKRQDLDKDNNIQQKNNIQTF